MYTVRIEDDIGVDVVGHLERMRSGLADLRPLAETIAQAMRDDREAAGRAGEDRFGEPLAPINHGVPLPPRELAHRGGSGPPLAPRGAASRLIADFVVDVVELGEGRIEVVGSWPTMPFLRYHTGGPEHSWRLPVRNVVGLRPYAHDWIVRAARDYVAGLMGGA